MKFRINPVLCLFFDNITIEPSIFLMYVSCCASNLLNENLFLQKACRVNGTSEPDLSTPCDDEKAGQLFLTSVNSWRHMVGMILMVIFTVFASSWSDKAGRRRLPLIFIPLVGQIVANIIGCLYSYFWHWPPMSAIILDTMVRGGTGGRLSMVYTSQLYISDITDDSNRTARLGMLILIQTIAIPIGNGISGFMLRRLGMFVSFSICTGLTFIAIICGYIFIKDISIPPTKRVSFWKTLSPTMVYDSFKTITKKREFNKRAIIGLWLSVDALSLFPIIGESIVLYLYLRYQFNWNEEDYSFFITSKLLIISTGTIFSAAVLSKYLKMHDAVIGIVASSTSLLAAVWYIFANKNWQLYLGSIFEFFKTTSFTVISSFLTKCLNTDETGHLMSIRCVLSIVASFCFPVYNYVYKQNMDTFPAAFFIITIVIYFWITFSLGLAYYISTRTKISQITPYSVDIKKQTLNT